MLQGAKNKDKMAALDKEAEQERRKGLSKDHPFVKNLSMQILLLYLHHLLMIKFYNYKKNMEIVISTIK